MNKTISELEKKTPLIEENYTYDSNLRQDERLLYQERITDLTIDIETKSLEVAELKAEMTAANKERTALADIVDKGKVERVTETAVKFYDPETGTIDIHVKEDDRFIHIETRQAFSTEIETWKNLQEQIKQTEIEAGNYRQKLHELAG